MKVPHRQKLRGLLFQPPSLSQGLALGTVAVTAGVISRALKAARVAAIQMPAQLLGATGRNGPHHFLLTGRYAMRSLVALPVLTKDIGKLGACLFFSCCPPISARQHRETAFLVRQSQQVQRIGRGGDLVLANLQVALGA